MHFPVFEEALRYLDAGLSFYPALPGGKQPHMKLLPRRWSEQDKRDVPTWAVFRDRQPTPDECRDWFKRKPAPNIVCITGKPSGRIVVDLDSPRAVAQFWAQYNHVPTPIVKSSRGFHVHFAYAPHDLQYDALAETEILSDGRCCTLPPSVHQTGHTYHWLSGYGFGTPLSPLPTWIIEAAKKVPRPLPSLPPQQTGDGYAKAVLQGELLRLAGASERRNAETYTCALKSAKAVAALGYEYVAGAIEAGAVAIGLPASEARQAVRSGLRTGMNKAA